MISRGSNLSNVEFDSPAMIALVLAIAGMMFLTTPCVRLQVTPSIPYCLARSAAFWYNHSMWSGSSLSSFLSVVIRDHGQVKQGEL